MDQKNDEIKQKLKVKGNEIVKMYKIDILDSDIDEELDSVLKTLCWFDDLN